RRRNSEGVASPFAKRKQRNSFRVAKNLLERLEPRVSKPTLGWNSRTLSALLVVPEFSHTLYRFRF
ncbi:MAG TPA: hypothetical protein VEW46_19910, partial [Pyrinomonadaceae bacterium]|nr:hypothetical protein [Pyrinomonadaceae bacterium]